MDPARACPLCLAPTVALGRVPAPRTRGALDVSRCTACGSLFNPSGYREDEARQALDAEYLASHFAQSRSYYLDLVTTAQSLAPIRTHLDVGCGVGPLVQAGVDRGLASEGVDLNPAAIELGTRRGLVLRVERLGTDAARRFDLVTCEQILEHLEDPREMLGILAAHAVALVFVNVPFAPPLGRLFTYAPRLPGSPFLDADVHIAHYTHRAFCELVPKRLGARETIPYWGATNSIPRRVLATGRRLMRRPAGYFYRL